MTISEVDEMISKFDEDYLVEGIKKYNKEKENFMKRLEELYLAAGNCLQSLHSKERTPKEDEKYSHYLLLLIGICIEYGAIVPNYKDFFIWRDQGDAQNQYHLAALYLQEDGVIPQDIEEGVRLLRLAVEQGHAEAQYILALMYLKDHTRFTIGSDEIFYLFRLSAEQGVVKARDSLVTQSKQVYGSHYAFYHLAVLDKKVEALVTKLIDMDTDYWPYFLKFDALKIKNGETQQELWKEVVIELKNRKLGCVDTSKAETLTQWLNFFMYILSRNESTIAFVNSCEVEGRWYLDLSLDAVVIANLFEDYLLFLNGIWMDFRVEADEHKIKIDKIQKYFIEKIVPYALRKSMVDYYPMLLNILMADLFTNKYTMTINYPEVTRLDIEFLCNLYKLRQTSEGMFADKELLERMVDVMKEHCIEKNFLMLAEPQAIYREARHDTFFGEEKGADDDHASKPPSYR